MAPSWGEMWRVFGRIGVVSFGGPAAQIGVMHRELVEARPWLSEAAFLRALSFCMMLPGPEAMQLATYAGWRMRGVWGGILAGALFVVPGAVVILALAACYVAWGDVPAVEAMFQGIKATVVVIVVQALIRLSQKAVRGPVDVAIACASFVALFVFDLSYPVLIAVVAGLGVFVGRRTVEPAAAQGGAPLGRAVLVLAVLWAVPLAVLVMSGGVFGDLAAFFSKLAVVSFGGAYAALSYMTQTVVQEHGWITTAQMVDALGLAETTPGPLILVTEFIGFLSGHGVGGFWAGVAGAVIALWMTFIPCFLWVFAGAPFIDRLGHMPRLSGALSAVTVAIVGVIANLSVWFALHVLFDQIGSVAVFGGALPVPVLDSLDAMALGLGVVAAVLMLGLKWSLLRVMPLIGALSLGLSMIG